MKPGSLLSYSSYLFIFFTLTIALLTQAPPLQATSPQQAQSQIEHGRYLVTVAACADCHTPFKPEFTVPTLTTDQIRQLSYTHTATKDPNRAFAGGRIFDLGPAGVIVSTNITSDPQTGIGTWTDTQLERALRTGQTPDGRQLHPIMPYNAYNQLSTDDMAAIIAYLRTLPPIAHDVLPLRTANTQELPAPAMPSAPIIAPTDDPLAHGEYLLKHLLACADCHTPTDAQSGQISHERFLSGGQPFEGAWGIVYGGNITPDTATGIGTWSNDDIKRVLLAGIRPDGRRLLLMPWEHYAQLTPTDLDALVHYLQNGVTAVVQQTPNPALLPDIIDVVNPDNPPTAAPTNPPWLWIGIIGLGLLLLIGIIWYTHKHVTSAR